MLKRIHFGKALTGVCAVGLSSIYLTSVPEIVRAEQQKDKDSLIMPTRRIGGGTRRDSCAVNQESLIALIPANSVGMTTSLYPTFFFYLPQTNQTRTVEFVLRNQQDELVYEANFNTAGKRGVVSLDLPTETEPLLLNQDYHWYLSLICNPENRAQDLVVEGIIRRIELEPVAASQLNQLKPIEKVDFYLQADLWYEAIATLAQLKSVSAHPAELSAKWTNLLQSVGLEQISNQPIIAAYRGSVPNRHIPSSLTPEQLGLRQSEEMGIDETIQKLDLFSYRLGEPAIVLR